MNKRCLQIFSIVFTVIVVSNDCFATKNYFAANTSSQSFADSTKSDSTLLDTTASIEEEEIAVRDSFQLIYIDSVYRLTTAVNSNYTEMFPILNPNKDELYFVRRYHPDNQFGASSEHDVWVAKKNDEGFFDKPVNIGQPINNEAPNAVCGFGKESGRLYLTNAYIKKNKMLAGVSYTEAIDSMNYAFPTPLEFEELDIFEGFFGCYVHPDEDVMIISMSNAQSYGREDLYVSTKLENNKWSTPVNLGLNINSRGFEISPYLSDDKMTLYFSSNGQRESFGDADIYVTKRKSDTEWTQWTTPENLGKAVNTEDFEAYYAPLSDTTGFFMRGSPYGDPGNIFFVYHIPKLIQVIDSAELIRQQQQQLLALKNQKQQESKTLVEQNNTTDTVYIDNNKGGTSKVVATDFSDDPARYSRYVVNPNRIVVKEFENVEFEFGSYQLTPSEKEKLRKCSNFLKKNPNYRVELIGHTDSIANELVNLILSDKRAYSAKQYLLGSGIPEDRISILGYGKLRPIASNATDNGREKNRRVEIFILDDISGRKQVDIKQIKN